MSNKLVTTKISKWGNGYGVRVPVAILKSLFLTSESEVVITSDRKSITISPKANSLRDMSLAEILHGVTPELLRQDEDDLDPFGKPQGREIW